MFSDKQLYELLNRIDECGYFDHSPSDQEEDEVSPTAAGGRG